MKYVTIGRHYDVVDVQKQHHSVVHQRDCELQSRWGYRCVGDDAVVPSRRNLEGCETDGPKRRTRSHRSEGHVEYRRSSERVNQICPSVYADFIYVNRLIPDTTSKQLFQVSWLWT